MNIKDMEHSVIKYINDFNLKTHLTVVPNVSWSVFSWGEADLISITKTGYLIEGEIKRTFSDFKADFKKKKYSFYKRYWEADIKKHYYIIPEELKSKVLFELSKSKMKSSGVIIVTEVHKGKFVAKIIKEAETNKKAKKCDIKKIMKIMRLMTFRFWNI